LSFSQLPYQKESGIFSRLIKTVDTVLCAAVAAYIILSASVFRLYSIVFLFTYIAYSNCLPGLGIPNHIVVVAVVTAAVAVGAAVTEVVMAAVVIAGVAMVVGEGAVAEEAGMAEEAATAVVLILQSFS
jgi:hypothetical protein